MQVNGRIRLVRDGEAVTLSLPMEKRAEGFFLREVPAGLNGFDVEPYFDEAWNAPPMYRGVSRPIGNMRLDLRTRGRNPKRFVDELVRLTSRPFDVVVSTPEFGERWVQAIRQGISDVTWHGGSAVNAVGAEVSLLLVVPQTLWESATEVVETTGGVISLETVSEPFWPIVTVTGQHEGVMIRLTADQPAQLLPYDPRGWVVDTQTHSIRAVTGEHDFPGVVPFWASPVEAREGVGKVEIIPTNPGPTFRARIEWTPRNETAW